MERTMLAGSEFGSDEPRWLEVKWKMEEIQTQCSKYLPKMKEAPCFSICDANVPYVWNDFITET